MVWNFVFFNLCYFEGAKIKSETFFVKSVTPKILKMFVLATMKNRKLIYQSKQNLLGGQVNICNLTFSAVKVDL